MTASTDGLPAPETVVERAAADDPSGDSPNVVLTGDVDAGSVERVDGAYVGETAGPLGRLAAAVAVDAGAVHYPECTLTAEGPWLVLAPLAGFAATVSKGVGRATVTLDVAGAATIDGVADALAAIGDAAAPRHDHYPVEDDDRGVFTRGMTTFALESVAVDEGDATVTLRVATTPATTPATVRDRFADVDGVAAVEYETVAGVERAAPSQRLSDAVEAAHRDVRGDCEYDWLPAPGAFAAVPGGEKVAVGTGTPDAASFSRDEYATCVDLLDGALDRLGVES